MTYVAIGASDTVGVGAKDPERDAWVARIYARLPEGSRFVRLGVSGSLTEQAVREQLPAALAANPDLVTVWLAVNDLNAQVPVQSYRSSLDRIVGDLSRSGARVFVGNVPDLTEIPVYQSVPRGLLKLAVEQYNQAIEAVVSDNDAVLVDLSKLEGISDPTVVASDGFHPSNKGYGLLAEEFLDAIRRDDQIGTVVSRATSSVSG